MGVTFRSIFEKLLGFFSPLDESERLIQVHANTAARCLSHLKQKKIGIISNFLVC